MADFKIFWLVFFALCCWFETSNGGYLITTPWVYRTGTVQRLNVHLHGNNMTWKVTASLKTPSGNKSISVATKTVPGNSYSTIDIKVPQNVTVKDNTKIKLQVHGVSQDGKHQFKKEQQLLLEKTENKETFFIQTDKSSYNPGQTVRIRVIGVKHDLKPLEGKVKRVFILNPNGVRMAQWDDVDFKNGIANVEMPLSKQPVLGKWTIVASYQLTAKQTPGTSAHTYKNKQAEKIIIVKKYELPKSFKVIIEPPSFVAIDSKHVSGRICARYNHGQPVIGDLKAVIATKVKEYKTAPTCPIFPTPEECPDAPDNDCSSDSECSDLSDHSEPYKCCSDGCDLRCVPAFVEPSGRFKIYASKTISTKIKGCVQFSFSNEDLGLTNLSRISYFSEPSDNCTITANVTEEVTGITKSGRTETKIEPFRLKITSNRGTTKYFRPGLPFTDVLSVTTIDGKPANNEKVDIIAKSQDYVKVYEKQYTVYDGVIHYEIPKIPSNAKTLYIWAKHHKNKEYLPSWTPRPQIIATSKLSKSSSFLSIRRQLKTMKAGETAKIDLMLTVSGDEENNDFVYQLMCAGQIYVSGKTRLSPFKRTSQTTAEGSLEFSLPQTLPVSSCRLLVYYMRKDGEIVPDSISLKVQGKLRNQVVVRFNNKHREPGERVQIALKAAPGSTVVLSAIDKRLRQETEDINVDKVLGFRERLNVGPARKSLRLETKIKEASNTFYDAGFVYLSDSPTFAVPAVTGPDTGVVVVDKRISNECRLRRRFRRQAPGNAQPAGLQNPLKTSNHQQDQAPETWLWTEETVSKSNGQRIITARVPDSITSWHLSAFAMSSTHGMGVAEPSSLSVSRPFFVSVTAPYAVVRDEKVNILTRVFSYMKTCATVVIQLKPTNDFQLISKNNQRLCICGDEAKSVNHVIKPTKVGKVSLTVTVKNVAPSLCKNPSQEPSLGISDSETRVLRVEARRDRLLHSTP